MTLHHGRCSFDVNHVSCLQVQNTNVGKFRSKCIKISKHLDLLICPD